MSDKRPSCLAAAMVCLLLAVLVGADMAMPRRALAETADEVEAVGEDGAVGMGSRVLDGAEETLARRGDELVGLQPAANDEGTADLSLTAASSDTISARYVDLSEATIEPIPTQLIHGSHYSAPNEKGEYEYGYHYSSENWARPYVTVVYDGKRVDNSTLDVSYENNRKPGTGTVKVKNMYDLSGPKLTATFAIELDPAYDISKARLGKIADCEFEPDEASCPDVMVAIGEKLLDGSCYDVEYKDNYDPGLATATIYGTGEYTGERKATFRILATLKSGNTLCYNKQDDYGDYKRYIKDQVYTGKAVVPPSLKVEFNEAWTEEEGNNVPAEDYRGWWRSTGYLRLGKDYTLSYENNVNPGLASVVIRGAGYYKGAVRKTFRIWYPLSKAKITGVKKRYTFKGWCVEPEPKVVALGKVLRLGRDYTIDYENNDGGGKATVVVRGKGGYKGSAKKTFEVRSSMKYVEVGRIKTQIPYARAVRPKPVVKINGHKLKRGMDYTVTYKNNTDGGTATMIIQGKGYYSGKKRVRFKIIPRGVGGTITKAEYKRLKLGMSYRAVKCLIGGPGKLVSESHGTDYDHEYYEWAGNTTYGYASASFDNGKLTYKYQYDLA